MIFYKFGHTISRKEFWQYEERYNRKKRKKKSEKKKDRESQKKKKLQKSYTKITLSIK